MHIYDRRIALLVGLLMILIVSCKGVDSHESTESVTPLNVTVQATSSLPPTLSGRVPANDAATVAGTSRRLSITVPTIPAGEGTDDALLIGELQLVGNCLMVTTELGTPYTIVWPYGTTIAVDDEVVVVYKPDGGRFAATGETVSIGGGEGASAAIRNCAGLAWYGEY